MAPQQQHAERTRDALVAAARKVFAEKGYPHATVADIVRQAGRAHGTFYLYFKNKQDVFSAVLDEVITSLEAQSRAMWRAENPTRSVWVTVRRFLEEFDRNRDLWLLLDQMAAMDPRFGDLRDRWRQAFVGKIRRGIETSASESIEGLDSGLLAEVMAAMVDEICRVAYLEGHEWDTDVLALHITTLWARGLGYPKEHLEKLTAELLPARTAAP